MIRKEVNNIMMGLLGWQQSSNPDFGFTIDEENATSSTGRYYEDFSKLIQHANIKLSHDNANITEDEYNSFLRSEVRSATRQFLNKLFTDDDVQENYALYDYEFDFNHPIDNVNGRWVGYEFDLLKRKDISIIVNSCYATFVENGTINLELYHSSKREPLQTKEITVVAGDTVQVDLDWILPHSNGIVGGKFYIGYRQTETTPRGYDRVFEVGDVQNYYRLAYVYPGLVDNTTAGQIFPVQSWYEDRRSWGLNFDISTYLDYTDIAIKNKRKFIEGVGMQVAINLLDQMYNSVRINANERVNAADIMTALEGIEDNKNGFFTQGLKDRLNAELKRVKQSFVPEQPIRRIQVV